MESEYVAMTKAAKKCVHYRQLLTELGFPQSKPTIIFEDNQSSINLTRAPELTKNSKHIHTRHHYIRDLVAHGVFSPQYITTVDQVADILTKALPKPVFLTLRQKLLNVAEKLSPPWSSLRGEC
jgi:hypothetical protein